MNTYKITSVFFIDAESEKDAWQKFADEPPDAESNDIEISFEEKRYCNLCGYETRQDEDGCVYHQRVKTDSEGVQYLKYDEFNQDGEEW